MGDESKPRKELQKTPGAMWWSCQFLAWLVIVGGAWQRLGDKDSDWLNLIVAVAGPAFLLYTSVMIVANLRAGRRGFLVERRSS